MRYFIPLVLSFTLFYNPLYGQVSVGGEPLSWSKQFKDQVATVSTPAFDQTKINEDELGQGAPELSYQFGYPFDVEYNMENSGSWEIFDDGSKLWRLQINSQGAYSINLLYSDFWLPEGAKFYIYSADRSHLIGAFTEANNKPSRKFATSLVKGESSVLEYWEPAETSNSGIINITRIVHGYRDLFNWSEVNELKGYGHSDPCQVNANCSESAEWDNVKRSTVMLVTTGGGRICTGVMVNNGREDYRNLLLTVYHATGGYDYWIAMFNYESPTCTNEDGPIWMTTTGSTLLAADSTEDFVLLELSEVPPASYNVHYSGWSLNGNASRWASFHHPMGDIKKFDADQVWPPGLEGGGVQSGSSGSPKFDIHRRLVGCLLGGNPGCGSKGAFSDLNNMWNIGSDSTERLREWLDPDNLGLIYLDGTDDSAMTFFAEPNLDHVPMEVNFEANSNQTVIDWNWDFGDGNVGSGQQASHLYDTAGIYDITCEMITSAGSTQKVRSNYIVTHSDTLYADDVEVVPGESFELIVQLHNTHPVAFIQIPLPVIGDLDVTTNFEFTTEGCRTEGFEVIYLNLDFPGNRMTLGVRSDVDLLPIGTGPVLKVGYVVGASVSVGESATIDLQGYASLLPGVNGSSASYGIFGISPTITCVSCCQSAGDANNDGISNVGDAVYLINFVFKGGPAPICLEEGDANNDCGANVGDAVYMINFVFKSGPAPICGCAK